MVDQLTTSVTKKVARVHAREILEELNATGNYTTIYFGNNSMLRKWYG